jgi:protease-4
MGGVAASGGYYISCNAEYIVADPYTITGSIGVIGMIPDMSETSKKIGINNEIVGHGKFINTNGLFTLYSKDFEKALQNGINDTYHEFKTRVSAGRKIKYDNVEAIAQGQVWSASKALQHNLIDEIGGLNVAIKKAAEIVNLENYNISYYPERKSTVEYLMEQLDIDVLFKGKLAGKVIDNIQKSLNIIEDMQLNPIQLRNEIILENIK